MDSRIKILRFAYLQHPQAFSGADLINQLRIITPYPALDKLEDEGLLKSWWFGDVFPRKKVYYLSRAGLSAAASYALSPVEGIPQR
jgi:DNA-binding PadR family transcriptional regulator